MKYLIPILLASSVPCLAQDPAGLEPTSPAPAEAASGLALTAAAPAELVREDALSGELAAPEFDGALRVRRVRLDPTTVARLCATQDPGFPAGALTVELFPGERWPLEPTRWKRTGERSFAASGRVVGHRTARWSMASRGGLVRINLRPGDGTVLSLAHGADGRPLVAQTRPGPGVRCGNEGFLPRAPELDRSHGRSGGADDPPVAYAGLVPLQLMVVMTPNAVDELGGGLAARLAVELAVEEGNDVFANSNVGAEWILEAAVQVDYSEGSDTHDDHLLRLTNPFDGSIDAIHQWRAVTHADFVAMIVDDQDPSGSTVTVGLGWVQPPQPAPWPGPFCTVDQQAMVTNLTLPHELGHNMGINHDLASGPSFPGITFDAYGWLFTGATLGPLRTVMGTGSATRIPFYSNPLVLFDGLPTGDFGGLFESGADAATAIASNVVDYSLFGLSPLPTDTSSSVCDFGAGPIQTGSPLTPFDLLLESVLQVQPSGGTVSVSGGGSTGEVPLLWFERRLQSGGNSPQPFSVGG